MFFDLGILIFIACSVGLAVSRGIDEALGKFVIDVSSSLFLPSSVTALLCINNEESVKFSRKLSQKYVIHDLRRSFKRSDLVEIRYAIGHQSIIVLDLDCPGALDIVIEASSNRMFVAPAKWLMIKDSRDRGELLQEPRTNENAIKSELISSWLGETFGDLQMLPDSEIIVGHRVDNDTIKILSPYRPSPRQPLILEDRGYWTSNEGFFFPDRYPTSRRRQNLQQVELKSCLVLTNTDTFNHLEDYRDKHVDAVTKANYPWVLHLIKRLNATVSFTSQNTWGYRGKNGSWSGMIGLLDRREIDLGGTATFFTSERIGVVEYVQLYTPTGSKFLFRRPPLSYVSNLFTLPFDRTVWLAIGIFLLLVILLLYMAMKWEYVMKSKSGTGELQLTGHNDDVPSLSNNLLVVIGAVFQQGFSYEPSAVPSRIIVLMLLFAALSLYASYTANIVALLQSTATSINTVRDLMDSPLKLGVYDIVYNRYYFQAAQDNERKEFYETLIKDKKGVWMNLEEGISRVRKGLFAFHVEVGAGYQLMQETFEEDEKCGIHEVDYLNLLNPLLVVQYQSPYLEMFRVGALWIRETGLQYRETSRLYTDKPVCQGHNSFVSVGVIDSYAAFMAMAYGVAFTVSILLLEVVWNKLHPVELVEDPPDNNSMEQETTEDQE